MAVDIIGTTAQYWLDYVFGSNVIIAGIVVLFFLILWGVRMGWGFETMLVIFIQLIFLIALPATSGGWDIGFSTIFGLLVIIASLAFGYIIIKTWKHS